MELTKRDMRLKAAALRDAMPPAERKTKSAEIEERLFGYAPFVAARTVMFYVSFRSEVETEKMIRRSLAEGKRVAVPSVNAKERLLIPSEVKDCDAELCVGAYGILEPRPEFLRPVPLEEIDFVVAPGLAFDRRGNRIGYGAGFYDRFIATLRSGAHVAALAFSCQVFDEIPHSPNDKKINAIITEDGIVRF